MKSFHHSSLESPRLKKLLAFLEARGATGATTFEITTNCETTRATSDTSELNAALRAAGDSRWVESVHEGESSTGRKIYRNTLRDGCYPNATEVAALESAGV